MTDHAEIPQEVLAEHVKEQVKLASEIHIEDRTDSNSEIDEWEHIDRGEVDYVEWADGDLHVMLRSKTVVQKEIRSKTFEHPAEYKEMHANVEIGIMWDFESKPTVFIEVVDQ